MTRDSTNNILLFNNSATTPICYFDRSSSFSNSPFLLEEDTTRPLNDTNKEFLLFPTYAKRDPSDNTQWVVKAKGWALSHNSSTAKQKMMMGITKSVAGKSSADRNASQMFEERFKYFLAANKKDKQFLIQAIGITSLEESRRPFYTFEQQQHLYDINMLSTRFNQMNTNLCNHQPITPPPLNDISWYNDIDNMESDPVLNRPSNPISSVLDGHYYDTMLQKGKRASATTTTTMCSLNNTPPLSESTTITTNADDGGVHLKTKGSGFLSGQFAIPHDNILNWAQEQNQCDARLIKIQSVSIENNKFLPNENIVNLVEPVGISIISDIDDTIKDTQIKAGARTVLSKTFFESPKSVEGMADAYMAWYSQGASFHYVSNSPFQLMPMLDGFIRDSQFPPGSMHLRDDGKLISRLVETPGQAKRDAILDILRDFPQRHFVLIGDSGEIDLEIYTRIAAEYPDQILKIYIRDVTTPTITELKASTSLQLKNRQRKSSGTLSSLFNPKRRSQSASDFTVPISTTTTNESEDTEEDDTTTKKKKFRSPLGVRRAMTTVFAEYAVEPHLTGHRSTIHVNDEPAPKQTDDDEQGLIDPHKFQKISTREACEQLYSRVAKARRQIPNIEIILFQKPEILSNDNEIHSALWDMWDNSSLSSDSSSFYSA